MVITIAQLHSTKPELRFCSGSNPARGVLEIWDDEDLWQWYRLEIRMNAFRRSTIPRKQFIIELNRNSCPYCLYAKKESWPNLPVGCTFPLISKSSQRSTRYRNNVNFVNLKDMESVFDCIHNYITVDNDWSLGLNFCQDEYKRNLQIKSQNLKFFKSTPKLFLP